MRIDKWLWAARFFKTRSQASDAAESGKVQVNGLRVKPSKQVAVGDDISVRVEHLDFSVKVLALSEKRGPAIEARTLYLESEESRVRREAKTAEAPDQRARPTKRDRRMMEKFRGGFS